MRILVTGGTGYVGSHVCVDLIEAGHEVVVVDNLSNSRNDVLDRISDITGRRPRFLCLDIRHGALLRAALRPYHFDGAIHLASTASTQESLAEPADCYRVNVGGTANVLDAANASAFVYGSSASVYGEPAPLPISEDHPLAPTSPYGRSKVAAENVVHDVVAARGGAGCVVREFNPAGAHESGRLGEDPRGAPSRLMALVEQVAIGVRDHVPVYGNDYPTRDGTAVRDYVHVMDVARAYRLGIEKLAGRRGVSTFNVGAGEGYSVLELLAAFERTTNRRLPYRVEPRRAGDVGECWADASRARRELQWSATRDLATICRDSMRWRGFWFESLSPATGQVPPGAAGRRETRARGRSRDRRNSARML